VKVVINKCFGGFGLSKAAQRAIFARGCDHHSKCTPEEYFGAAKNPGWRSDFERQLADESSYGLVVVDELIISDEHRNDTSRACPVLVAVVEEMGDAAFGQYSKLRVVEVPDGVEFDVDDYDGQESIHERHRSWG